jgi:hypothetical protein
METLSRLNNVVGKQGFVKIPFREAEVTFLSVDPPTKYPTEIDDDPIQGLLDMGQVIDRSQFTVRYENGILVDGRNTGVVPGRYMSRIKAGY